MYHEQSRAPKPFVGSVGYLIPGNRPKNILFFSATLTEITEIETETEIVPISYSVGHCTKKANLLARWHPHGETPLPDEWIII